MALIYQAAKGPTSLHEQEGNIVRLDDLNIPATSACRAALADSASRCRFGFTGYPGQLHSQAAL
jgi:hypothetical protein